MKRKWSYAGLVPPGTPSPPLWERAVSSPWWIWEHLEPCHWCPPMGNQPLLQGVSGEVRCCLPVPGMCYQESLLPGAASLAYEGWDESAERKAVNGCRKEWLHHLPGGWATRVTSWLCKNWATFGQGGEVLAKAFSLLIDSYLLHEGKTSVRRSGELGGHWLPPQKSVEFYLLSTSNRVGGLGWRPQKVKDSIPFPSCGSCGEAEGG